MTARKRNAGNRSGRKRSRNDDKAAARGTDGEVSRTRNVQYGVGKKDKPKHRQTNWYWPNAGQMLTAAGVLVVAIGMALLWNMKDPVDPRIQAFLSRACSRKGGAKCTQAVTPTRRTLQASRNIRKGEVLVQIPRKMQIWDLDALRDDFVRNELFDARHPTTANRLSSGAFLAAFLALRLHNTTLDSNIATNEYLAMLPTQDELSDHPVLWNVEELAKSLNPFSTAFNVAKSYRDMVQSEYDAFSAASARFAELIDYDSYRTARVNVLTRSFSPGTDKTVGSWQADPPPQFESIKDELRFYKQKLDIDLSLGSHVLVPILDMLNHHPNPNVGYRFDDESGSFVIKSETQIPVDWELVDSYGLYSDAHLFAKFGFNNGDGSGYTTASMAIHHRVLDQGLQHEFSYLPYGEYPEHIRSIQRRDLAGYLVHDDGYNECIEGPETHPDEFALKLLKLEHLSMIANDAARWSIDLPPRRMRLVPQEKSTEPITLDAPELDPRLLRFDYSKIVSTCRLIALTVRDFDGTAFEMLENNKDNTTFQVPVGDKALEYRAVTCIARLASTALVQFQPEVSEQKTIVERLNREAFQSRNWTVAHVRYGEMQTLQAISGIAFATTREWDQQFVDREDEGFMVRERQCPPEFTERLVDLKNSVVAA